MKDEKINLKDCPFCGGKAKYHDYSNKTGWVWCLKCGISTGNHVTATSQAEAVRMWNKRVVE